VAAWTINVCGMTHVTNPRLQLDLIAVPSGARCHFARAVSLLFRKTRVVPCVLDLRPTIQMNQPSTVIHAPMGILTVATTAVVVRMV